MRNSFGQLSNDNTKTIISLDIQPIVYKLPAHSTSTKSSVLQPLIFYMLETILKSRTGVEIQNESFKKNDYGKRRQLQTNLR